MKRRTHLITLLSALVLGLALTAAGVAKEAQESVGPQATEANITRLTAGIFGQSQFSHHPLDNKLADALIERYLDALDAEHMLFLQSDVAEFAAQSGGLAQATRSTGDTHLAHFIFARYLERVAQRAAYVTDTLQRASFEFTGQSSYWFDRHELPRPQDLTAAQGLWRQRLRLDYLQEKLDEKSPEAIVTTLTRRAAMQLQLIKQMSRDAVLEIYLSALAHLYDPHSDYLGREQLREFSIAMNLSLFGIGAKLQYEDGRSKVVEVLPGSPAARSGLLHPGDQIVAVAQGAADPVDVIDLPLARTVELIRGAKGSVVKLTVIPASAGDAAIRTVVSIVRDEIKLEEQRAKSKIVEFPSKQEPSRRIAVIELPSFYADIGGAHSERNRKPESRSSATADVALLLKKLKSEHVEGLVLDLRGNGGGSLDEAINLTGLFIGLGPVVQVRGPDGAIEVGTDTDPAVLYDGPLIVLTSRFSASASEILAGALQDYGRAVIVGDSSTFGKGTVQSLVRLATLMDRVGVRYSYDPGALDVTIGKFYRPSGASTQLKGVVADIVLPSLTDRDDIGESVLDNPLPWDTVPPADYKRLAMVEPYLASLRSESARRVANGRAFAYLKAEIGRVKQKLDSKTVSLNEAERRQELADFKRRKALYDAADQTAVEPTPLIYELSVHDAVLPGLPAPSIGVAGGAAVHGEGQGALENRTRQASDESMAQRDLILDETEKIINDYVSLIGNKDRAVTTEVFTRAGR